jgi:hypothetical protein
MTTFVNKAVVEHFMLISKPMPFYVYQPDNTAFNAYQPDDMAFNTYQSVENN